MRQGRRVRCFLGALCGGVALVVTTGGDDCDGSGSSSLVESAHTVTVTVQTASMTPSADAVVTVWIVDSDLPGSERAPIVLGTGSTDGEGIVQFTYMSFEPPYVCGYEVKDPSATNVLAAQTPLVTNVVSTPGGYVNIVLP